MTADEAEAIVWVEGGPEEIGPYLHDGVRWVQLSSAGIEDWFAAGVIDRARVWTAAKGVYAGPIAEYIVAVAYAFARRIPELLIARRWHVLEPRRLEGATVAVIGAGGIGQAAAALFRAVGARVLALTRSGRPVPGADRSAGLDALDDLVSEADYLVLALPDTAATRGLFDASRLARMKRGAVIINVGRGSAIVTDDLVDSLRARHLGGAALDVTDPEPLPEGHPLWEMSNVIVSSHGSNTPALGAATFADRVRENVSRFARGEPLLGVVDVEAGY